MILCPIRLVTGNKRGSFFTLFIFIFNVCVDIREKLC